MVSRELHVPQHQKAPCPFYYDIVVKTGVRALMAAYGLQHQGAEVLQEIEGAAIIAPIHRSMLDVPAVAQAALEAANVHIHFMAKPELWKVPLFGRLITAAGAFPIDRKQASLPSDTRTHLEDLINGNAFIGLFPEAKRRSSSTVDVKHLRGAHTLAAKYRLPIVPVGIAGTEKEQHRPIRVLFGDMIAAPEPAADHHEFVITATRLRQTLVESLQDLQDRATTLAK